MKNVKTFIQSLYNQDGSFSFAPTNRISNLYSTCFGVMALDLIRGINQIDTQKTTNFIKKHQDKKTGYFIDKNCIPKDNATHNIDYIKLQLTDFAQMALSVLNNMPNYDYYFLERYKNKDYLKKWFYNLNWKDPWLTSNIIMFILNCMIYEDEKNNKDYIYFIIELLNKNQNTKTGFWNLDNKVLLHNQMAGAYHFLLFYTYLNKKPNYVQKIINSTLSVQDYDGLFNYAGGGGSCDDLDAIDLLCRSTFYFSYRKKDIKKALIKSYKPLMGNQNKDGGFCWAKRDFLTINKFIYSFNPLLIFKVSFKDFLSNGKSKIFNQLKVILNKDICWEYSSLESMKIKCNESDIWSTWFRLSAIALIEETFPEICDYKKSFNWKMRKKCGLGFYKK